VILGGTFDPVHYGHLRLADDVRRALGVGEVRLMPGRDPPHRAGPDANAVDRAAMLHLAVAGHPGLVVDGRELNRTGKSYSVVTLEELRAEYPERPLWLLLGADAFRGLPLWHRWRDIFDLAHIVVVERPGVALREALPPELATEWKKRQIRDAAPLFSSPAGAIYVQHVSPQPISATAIRAKLAQGVNGNEELAQLLPAAVLTYIDQHHLYRPPPDAT
jgi:nicotinate-nucleotide adenylyltransferase